MLAGIYAAVTRRRPDEPNRPAWHPEQCLTVAEAVRAYTAAPAYAAGEEREKGMLRTGYVADFVALSADPFTAAPDALPDTRVVLTVVGGEVRYSGSSDASGSSSASSSSASEASSG